MNDVSLKREKIGTWFRLDGTEGREYGLDSDNLDDVSIDELRAAVDADLRLSIVGGSGTATTTSLARLAPLIPELRDLQLATANRITGLDVLSGARNLRSFEFTVGQCADVLDLSLLPRLEEFRGDIKRGVSSVLRNPGLRFLQVWGAIPKSFARVTAPVEYFEQEGGRSQITLPEFAHPEAIRRLERRGPAQFDLGQLSAMTNLTELEVTSCNEVSALSVLSELPKLSKLRFKGVGTGEPWDLVPALSWAFLIDLSPYPSSEVVARWRAAGWIVPDDAYSSDAEEIVVDDAGDGESWGVFMSRFESLAASVDELEGTVAGGRHGELLVLSAVAELRAQGATLDPEPDSEGDSTAVYFPTREQAEQVATLARTILHSDTATRLRYLRSDG